jgi:predicted kinase
VQNGHICDGHGDVRCESVCVTDKIHIFDCIEFNDRFRCGDVASEVAFLAMDLDARGRPDLGYLLTEQYSACSGDDQIFALLPFYRCYRAFVRGKVLSFRLDEPEFSAAEQEDAAARASSFFDLAARYATPLKVPTVIAVAGLSGTGKTTLAHAIAGELGLRVVSSDAIRKSLFGHGTATTGYDKGHYSQAANHCVYRKLLESGRALLEQDGAVILDATFRRAADRAAARAMADAAGAQWRLIECRLPSEQVESRLAQRTAHGESPSDATWETYLQQRREFEPLQPPRDGPCHVINTGDNLAAFSRSTTDWLRAADIT